MGYFGQLALMIGQLACLLAKKKGAIKRGLTGKRWRSGGAGAGGPSSS